MDDEIKQLAAKFGITARKIKLEHWAVAGFPMPPGEREKVLPADVDSEAEAILAGLAFCEHRMSRAEQRKFRAAVLALQKW